ncbi:MAG TPA: 2-oxoglutarate dehydrogenase E1 component, partial [Alphaproteobacteria bacterium]|nr:2-oxoglutarate dehydrogenase E1 component [Alphaproteobacteria bacterium]
MTSASSLKTILSGVNAEYIANLYREYLKSPAGVDPSWQSLFADLRDDEASLLKQMIGASWSEEEYRAPSTPFGHVTTSEQASQAAVRPANQYQRPSVAHPGFGEGEVQQATRDSIAALMMIRAYRAIGHLAADLDPLGLKQIEYHKELDPSFYGFGPQDMTRQIYIGGVLGMDYANITQIREALHNIYCGKIGVEFLHSTSPEEKGWIQQRIEVSRNQTPFSVEEKTRFYNHLIAAEGLERFLHTKYVGTKRFGVDGGESFIASLEETIHRAAELGCEEVVLGMAHRGRLNVLTNVVGKPYTSLFAEF